MGSGLSTCASTPVPGCRRSGVVVRGDLQTEVEEAVHEVQLDALPACAYSAS